MYHDRPCQLIQRERRWPEDSGFLDRAPGIYLLGGNATGDNESLKAI